MKSLIKRSFSKNIEKCERNSIKMNKSISVKMKKKLSHDGPFFNKSHKINENYLIFGGKIEDAISTSFEFGLLVPNFFNEWISYIEANGTKVEQIYDTASNKRELESLIFRYNSHEKIILSNYDCCLIANLLIIYLNTIDGGLFEVQHNEIDLLGEKERITTNEILYILSLLPTPNYSIFGCLIRHIRIMAEHEEQTKMSMDDLVHVFSAALSINRAILKIILTDDEIFPGKHFIRNFSRTGGKDSNELILSEMALRGEISFHESTINLLTKSHLSNDSGMEIMRHKYSLNYLQNELDGCLNFIPESPQVFLKNEQNIFAEESDQDVDKENEFNLKNKINLESTFLSDDEEYSYKEINKGRKINVQIKLNLQSELNKISNQISEQMRSESTLRNEQTRKLKDFTDKFANERNLEQENLVLKEINAWLIEKVNDIIRENAVLKSYIQYQKDSAEQLDD